MKEIKGFTTFHLKIIALVLMVIDHIGEFLPGMPGWLRYVGRLSAPLFFFCMCWGLEYTKNRKRYLLRLYLASVAMALLWCGLEIVFPFFAGYGPAYSAYNENNIFSTLFITAVFITILTRFKGWKRACLFSGVLLWEFAVGYLMVFGSLPETLSLPPVLVSAFLGSLFTCEGGCFACLLGILLYFLKKWQTQTGHRLCGLVPDCRGLSKARAACGAVDQRPLRTVGRNRTGRSVFYHKRKDLYIVHGQSSWRRRYGRLARMELPMDGNRRTPLYAAV